MSNRSEITWPAVSPLRFGGARAASGRRPAGPRVVFLPGALGSVLVDQSLTAQQARKACEDNLGARDRLLRGSALYPCDKRPETLWGNVGSLHWFFNPPSWQQRMTGGNGFDLRGAVHPDSLVDVDIRLRRARIQVRPYAGFLKALRDAGADVLVFPYDWRLSNRHNAHLLQRRILQHWFGGELSRERKLREEERVTFIGHSMGGLIARFFLESAHLGYALARRLITIGTPHLGAPQAYLHLIGRTLPFPENPFSRSAHAALVQELRVAGISPQGDFAAQLIPGKVQTAVFRFMASAFEVLPVYNFVVSRGQHESFVDTYRNEVHAPTGQPAMKVIGNLRQGMVCELQLDSWLLAHDLEYHLLGATGFSTALGYDRGRDRLIAGREGDGTVPIGSARLVPRSTDNLHVRTVAGGDLGHQRLCERRDVQAYCLHVLRDRRPAPRAAALLAVQIEDFVAMAKRILQKAPRSRGIVLSVVRLATDDCMPLIDTTTEPSRTSSRRRLKNPPNHLSSPEIFQVQSPRLGRAFQYVWMLSNEQATHPVGGMLFLPESGKTDVYLVTFNVGNLDDARCRNAHHAEMQLVRWVGEQPPRWRARIRILHIANRSRSASIRGYSPCNACCSDLAIFLDSLKALSPGRRIDARISWLEPYTKGRICGHPTDAANLARLRASGWQLDDGRSPAAPPPQPPPSVFVATSAGRSLPSGRGAG